MILKTKKYKTAFTTVPNDPINNRELSYEALGVWLYLMSKPDDWQVKMSDLRNRTKTTGRQYGKDAIQGILNELKSIGLAELVYHRSEDGKTNLGSSWVISDSPNPENRNFWQPENQTARKSTPLINKELNTNKRDESAQPIPEEKINTSFSDISPIEQHANDLDPVEYITSVLDLTPQMTLDRWCMNYKIDPIELRDQMEAFACWYFTSLSEKLTEEHATERIYGMKLRALISAFETKFLRNYKQPA